VQRSAFSSRWVNRGLDLEGAVRDELGASDAAMITKRSFTKGARDTAYDDLAMLRLRAYDPSVDRGTWIKKVSVNIEIGAIVQRDVLVLVDGASLAAKELGIRAEGWMDVFDVAGKRLGNVAGLNAPGKVIEERKDVTCKGFEIDGDPVEVEGLDGLVKIMHGVGGAGGDRHLPGRVRGEGHAAAGAAAARREWRPDCWQGDRRREIAGVEGRRPREGRAGDPPATAWRRVL
jgi:hypothetical protein